MTICGQAFDVVEQRAKLVGGPEQKRSVDAEDPDIGRDRLVLQDVRVAILHVVVGHRRDRGRVGDPLDEEQRGTHHADRHGLREIGEDRQSEGHDQTDTSVFVRRSSSGISTQSPML